MLNDMIDTGSTRPSCKKIKMFGQRVASLVFVTCQTNKIFAVREMSDLRTNLAHNVKQDL